MSSKTSFIIISPSLSEKLGVQNSETVTVAIGNRAVRTKVKVNPKITDEKDIAVLSSVLCRDLKLVEGLRLNIRRSGKILKVGPLVGILAAGFNPARGSFGVQNSYFIKLLKLLRTENGVGFVFTPKCVDWKRKLIRGYVPAGLSDDIWERVWLPFPDVCYNRYFPPKNGETSSFGTVSRLRTNGVKAFNAVLGSKWSVYNRLYSVEEIKDHIPETVLLRDQNTIKNLINKHERIYVKPVNECQGRGISRIRRKDKLFLVQSTGKRAETSYKRIYEVYQKIKQIGNRGVMLAQQAIKTPLDTNHFDFRVMVQKDRNNQWGVSGIAARIGVKGQITTNLHTGGKADNPETILKNCGFDENKAQSILSKIENLSLSIAKILEKKSKPLGELGLDFIIDEQGKVWFLEANPKPSRKSFAIMEAYLKRRTTILRPMQFACYLAGF